MSNPQDCEPRLRAYTWQGNIQILQNQFVFILYRYGMTCKLKKKRCLPSSTFTLHRPHLRGPNGRQTSYQGKHCSPEPNDRKIEGNTPPWDRKTRRWSWQVLLKLFDVRRERKRKGVKKSSRNGRFCRRFVGHVPGPDLSSAARPQGCQAHPQWDLRENT